MKQAPKTIYIERLNKYAVQKYLLGPKLAKEFPSVKSNAQQYVIIPNEIYQENKEEWEASNLMDGYDYSGVFEPYAHQIYTARQLVTHHSMHVHNSQGTGKTMSTLWAADQLIEKGIISKVLIVCTKSGMQNAWEKELGVNLMWRPYNIVNGDFNKRVKLLNDPAPHFFVINHDGLTSLIQKEKIPHDIDLIIYDESTALKTPSTKRFKSFYKYYSYLKSTRNARIWLLTGTPIAQSPLDAYTQAKLVNPGLIPKNFTLWKDTVMVRINDFIYRPRDNAHELCYRILQPSIRFELDDCTDLPHHTFIDIKFDKTVEQARMFKTMAQEYVAETAGINITATHGGSKYIKLLQILAGALYTSDNEIIELDASTRFDALCDIIDETNGPLVIFCSFKHIQKIILNKLKHKYSKERCELINGDTSLKERTAILNDFEHGRVKFLVAHPVTLSHSVDLTTSNTIVWYTAVDRNELYLQALDRIRRLSAVKKGHNKLLIYHLISDNLEAKIYQKLRDKTFTQNQLFKLIREELEQEFAL